MLGQRILTAAVLLAVLLPAIFLFEPWVWGLVTLFFLAVAAHEWTLLLGHRAAAWPAALALGAAGLLILYWDHAHGWPPGLVMAVSGLACLAWLVLGPLHLRQGDARRGGWPLAAALLLACWVALLVLRERGAAALLAAMAIVWVADVAAYFVGRAFGRRKLAPSISPGKSWEGAIGGFIAVAVVGLAVARLPALADTLPARLVAQWGWIAAAVVLIGLAALSIVGDLHESLLKRQAGVKDSGKLLPGHGGVLDRVDALIPTMPAAVLLHQLLG
ncbi:MAG: phosphatidate cytidylyltransferase [Burkholderiales bacterium]|nr:phosphatidate cytidylyltransferase [Burkholderiales bacterium]